MSKLDLSKKSVFSFSLIRLTRFKYTYICQDISVKTDCFTCLRSVMNVKK